MTVGVQALALSSVPFVFTNGVFLVRRFSKGADSMNENPLYGMMNMDIAAGQTLKGLQAAKDIAAVNTDAKIVADGASEAIKNLSKTNKVVNGLGKIVDFTARNINPIICATSAANVLFGADDKVDAGAREVLALSGMFASERVAKTLFEMPYTTKEHGKTVVHTRKNPFLNEKQTAAIKDFCETKKLFNKVSLKFLPGAIKGLGFVSASIAGYKLGNIGADYILGSKNAAVN